MESWNNLLELHSNSQLGKQGAHTLLVETVNSTGIWKTGWQFLKSWNIELPCHPAMPLQTHIQERKTHIHAKTRTCSFIAASFIIDKSRNNPNAQQLVNVYVKCDTPLQGHLTKQWERMSGWVGQSRSVESNSLRPQGLYSPWNSPGQNTKAGSLFLLQGIFPTQGLNPGLPHCRQILYQLSHKGSPRRHEIVANATTRMNPENSLSERYRRVHSTWDHLYKMSSIHKCVETEVICISAVIDISPCNLDSSLCFIQPSISHNVHCI